MADAVHGEEIYGAISLKDKNAKHESLGDEVIKLLVKACSSYKFPKKVFVFEELPKTLSGKVMRKMYVSLSKMEILKQFIDLAKELSSRFACQNFNVQSKTNRFDKRELVTGVDLYSQGSFGSERIGSIKITDDFRGDE